MYYYVDCYNYMNAFGYSTVSDVITTDDLKVVRLVDFL